MTDRKPRIVICDDEQSRREQWQLSLTALLGDAADIEMLPNDVMRDDWTALLDRRAAARDKRGREPIPWAEMPGPEVENNWTTAFDEADILVVDYDLFRFDRHNYLTGAIVAYVARCYSRCGVIIGVNEYGPNPFNLTLIPDPNSFADISIGAEQIGNRNLWHADAHEAFAPWAWRPAFQLIKQLKAAQALFDEQPERLVLDAVGLRPHAELLPRSVLSQLERGGQRGAWTTLLELARGARMGYREADEAPSRAAVARVAAARTARWLEEFVLPLQDPLIDVPHLAARNAALIEGITSHTAPEDIRTLLDATARRAIAAQDSGVIPAVQRYAAETGPWLCRPAFDWTRVSADRNIPGARNPREIPRHGLVFCEDASRFAPAAEARRFVSRLESSTSARWVLETAPADGIQYQPTARFAL